MVAIVVLLLAMLLPGLSAARERVRRLLCANNMRQWGVAYLAYQNDHRGYLPTEGSYLPAGIEARGAWYNALPPYLGMSPYVDLPRADDQIKELPNIHIWICPSKNLTDAYKSGSGKNQFHYGMNQVLDGLGSPPNGSRDTPGFPDLGETPIPSDLFLNKPFTVLMFDIAPNSPAGTPRNVATEYQRGFRGESIGKFHGDYANVLFLTGQVGNCATGDLVTGRDFVHGDIIWDNQKLYWGYPRPRR